MKLLFLGTRGGIKARSPEHYMHSVLLITYRTSSLLIDWGADWLGKTPPPAQGLLVTHAHPDHVGGLAKGFPYTVYGSAITIGALHHYPIKTHIVKPEIIFNIGSFRITPFEVYHSIRAPALGYRIHAGKHTLFYVSDLIAPKHPKKALSDIDLYVGDGAIITRRMLIRKKDHEPTGHSPISDQLAWCHKYKVPQAIFTHCGSEIVKGDTQEIQAKIQELAQTYSVKTCVAIDGFVFTL